MKDYYKILGVLDDAEDIIIRAAYKALAQRYHPDKWRGDATEANQRMSDINEAYGILSDIERRKKYDEEYFRNRARDESSDEENEDEYNFISEDDEAWQIALEFFPNIKEDYNGLLKISNILANTFKAIIIDKQEFKQSKKIKDQLEKEYLVRYYGSDEEINCLAKELLVKNEKKVALKINKIIRVMGRSITSNQLYEKIEQEFTHIKIKDFISNDIYLMRLEKDLITNQEIELLAYKLFPHENQRYELCFKTFHRFFVLDKLIMYNRKEVIELFIKRIKSIKKVD